MSDRRGLVVRVAAAVGDGEPVGWDHVESLATSHDKSLIDQLRALSSLELGIPRSHAGLPSHVALPRWWAALLVAAALHVVLGAMAAASLAIVPAGQEGRFLRYQLAIFTSFAAGAMILILGGREDSRAHRLGHVYLLMATAFARPLLAASAWGVWTHPVSAVLGGLYPEALLPYALWLFAREFPRTHRFDAFDRAASVCAFVAACGGAALLVNSWLMAIAGAPWPNTLGQVLWRFRRVDPSNRFWDVVYVLVVPALIAPAWRARSSSADERRRVMWFVAALALGMLPVFLIGLLQSLLPRFAALMKSTHPAHAWIDGVVLFALLSVPFTTSYTVLVHQALTVRVAIHRTVRSVLARSSLLAVTVLPLVLPLLQAYRHRDRRVDELLADPQSRWALWAMVSGIGLLAARRRLVAALDRVLIGKPLDHSNTLAAATSAIARGRTVREVAFEVARELEDAFGVTAVSVLSDHNGVFRALHGAAGDLPADSALIAMLLETPSVVLDPERRLFQLLPRADREWLVRSGVEILVRVPAPVVGVAGIVAIGARKTGGGFSRDDRAFIAALATTAGLALHRGWHNDDPGSRSADREIGALECPTCGTVAETPSCGCSGAYRPALVPPVLAAKFHIERRIGRGGMGVVYLARDAQLERAVALKTLPRVTTASAAAMFAEARTMAVVEHPNLALIYGLELWRGTPVLVVEYLAGGTLAARLNEGPLSVTDALSMGAALAEALAALHRAGILHRDLKPSNIGFTRGGVPKLLDFGVARLIARTEPGEPGGEGWGRIDQSRTRTTAIAGTPLYLSPEALRGATPDVRADLWGLSLVVCEAMIGRYPFPGATVTEVVRHVQGGAGLDWRQWESALPAPVIEWLARALHPEVRRRTAVATAVAAELRAVAAGLPPDAPVRFPAIRRS